MTQRILLANGPNLNLLGAREPSIYGTDTLDDIVALCERTAASFDYTVHAVQSNHEGTLIDAIHAAQEDCCAIIINPGALSHTSIALRDALSAVALPLVEVHLSNVHAREAFRRTNHISPVANLVIAGAGAQGYEFAVRYLAQRLAATS